MRNNFKLALVPLALASAFASNSAMAACLEIYTGDNTQIGQYVDSSGATQSGFTGVNFNGLQAFDAEYSLATCVAPRGGASTTNLEPLVPLTVAQELTKSFEINLFDPSTVSGAALSTTNTSTGFSKNIVYIPTAPIPGGTRITLQLDNATWELTDPQLHLLALNDDTDGVGGGDLDGANPNILIAAATTDGTDSNGNFVFLVPSGLTIPAGTRLALSTETNTVNPPSLAFANDDCSVNPTVSVGVPSAINNIGGVSTIAGGIVAPEELIRSRKQFTVFQNHSTAEGTVDALAPSLRTQFVVDSTDGSLDGATTTTVHLASTFVDGLETALMSGGVEVGVGLTNSDQVEIWPYGTPSVADNVDLQLFDEFSENGQNADTFATNIPFDTAADNNTYVYSANLVDIPAAVGDAKYGLSAVEMFDGGTNNVWWALTQTDTNEVIEPSRFFVNFTHTIDFANDDLLDHCAGDLRAYSINTNGSVLKVPYHFEAGGNWIRVTNEFNQEAVISMDIQGEVGTTAAPNSYVVGTVLSQVVPPNGSVLLYVDDLVAQAEANGYMSGGNVASGENQRHTITLVVSAPSDQVHGVAVQKVDGNDRVVPVLDLNNWQQ